MREEVEELKKELNEVKEQSLAMEILKEQKKSNKRLFNALIVVLCMWFATIGYLVYVLNDIGVVEETTQEITDFDTINGSVVNKGDINGEN